MGATKKKTSIKTDRLTSKKILKIIAEFALDKKAEDIVILDMRKVANFCDYFVVCTGSSDRQIKAIAQSIADGVKDLGFQLRYKDGIKDSHWVLLDMGDIVIHVFEKEAREFYGLEYLWQDAAKVNWQKK